MACVPTLWGRSSFFAACPSRGPADDKHRFAPSPPLWNRYSALGAWKQRNTISDNLAFISAVHEQHAVQTPLALLVRIKRLFRISLTHLRAPRDSAIAGQRWNGKSFLHTVLSLCYLFRN